MKKKVLWITETALLLACLVTLQWATKGFGQMVTGSCVNALLALAALFVGLSSGLTVAVLSPVLAFLLGVAPNIVTVPVIMVGNGVFVLLLWVIARGGWVRRLIALVAAAVGKFAVLYALVNWIVCGVLAQVLLSQGILKAPMLKILPATFGVIQLLTALIGGGLALLIVPSLKKALHK